jgi:putative membrane protein
MSPKRTILLTLGVCLLLLQNTPIRGQNASGGNAVLSANDRNFILSAAQSGLHEVQMGMLAVERGTNTAVKAYAQHLLDDHTLTNAEIEALARVKGVALANQSKTDPAVIKLSQLTGLEFDQEFVRQEIDNHVKNLAEFEREDQSAAADPDIKGFAHSALPKMRDHLEQAKALKP